jgi:hypothetical protein
VVSRGAHSVISSISQRVCTHEQHKFDHTGRAGISRRRRHGRLSPRLAVRNAGVIRLEAPRPCNAQFSPSRCRIRAGSFVLCLMGCTVMTSANSMSILKGDGAAVVGLSPAEKWGRLRSISDEIGVVPRCEFAFSQASNALRAKDNSLFDRPIPYARTNQLYASAAGISIPVLIAISGTNAIDLESNSIFSLESD